MALRVRELSELAREHGVDARLERYASDTHVFQVFWSFLPEAVDALEHAGGFIGEVLPGASAASAPG